MQEVDQRTTGAQVCVKVKVQLSINLADYSNRQSCINQS
jgi:hypothetical protein